MRVSVRGEESGSETKRNEARAKQLARRRAGRRADGTEWNAETRRPTNETSATTERSDTEESWLGSAQADTHVRVQVILLLPYFTSTSTTS